MKIRIVVGVRLKDDKPQMEVLYCGGDGEKALEAYTSADIGDNAGDGGKFDAVYLFKRPSFDRSKKRRKRPQILERRISREEANKLAAERNRVEAEEIQARKEAEEKANRDAVQKADDKRKAQIASERKARTERDAAEAKAAKDAASEFKPKAKAGRPAKAKKEKLNPEL